MNGSTWKAAALVAALCCAAPRANAGDPAEFQTVAVEKGDSLLLFAQKHLKDPSHWVEISKYNSLPSPDPKAVLPAMTLRLPTHLLKSGAPRGAPTAPIGLTGGGAIPDIRSLKDALTGSKFADAVSGYRVECGVSRDFTEPLVRMTFDPEAPITPAALALSEGTYWCRIAVVDLLGDQGKFSETRRYGMGSGTSSGSMKSRFTIISPEEGDVIETRDFRVKGKVAKNFKVLVNGRPVHPDARGIFSVTVRLKPGSNTIKFAVSDESGDLRFVDRNVTYQP
ncbi:MAG: hypothetical protein HZB91_04265 [Elusimicrobia bacterium]|nr:hypothetical protein [Elusimicrobiota bacterium]